MAAAHLAGGGINTNPNSDTMVVGDDNIMHDFSQEVDAGPAADNAIVDGANDNLDGFDFNLLAALAGGNDVFAGVTNYQLPSMF